MASRKLLGLMKHKPSRKHDDSPVDADLVESLSQDSRSCRSSGSERTVSTVLSDDLSSEGKQKRSFQKRIKRIRRFLPHKNGHSDHSSSLQTFDSSYYDHLNTTPPSPSPSVIAAAANRRMSCFPTVNTVVEESDEQEVIIKRTVRSNSCPPLRLSIYDERSPSPSLRKSASLLSLDTISPRPRRGTRGTKIRKCSIPQLNVRFTVQKFGIQSKNTPKRHASYNYVLHVKLLGGDELVHFDATNESPAAYVQEPVVVFGQESRELGRSRGKVTCRDPQWDQSFIIHLNNTNEPLTVQLYDRKVKKSHFVSEGQVQLNKLTATPETVTLHLQHGRSDPWFVQQKLGTLALEVYIEDCAHVDPLQPQHLKEQQLQPQTASDLMPINESGPLFSSHNAFLKRIKMVLKEKQMKTAAPHVQQDVVLVQPDLAWDTEFFKASSHYSELVGRMSRDRLNSLDDPDAISLVSSDNLGSSDHISDYMLEFRQAILQVLVVSIVTKESSILTENDIANCVVKAKYGFKKLSKSRSPLLLGNKNKKLKSALDILECELTSSFGPFTKLELTLWNKTIQIGQCTVDISSLPMELTLELELTFSHEMTEVAMVTVLLTITGLKNPVVHRALTSLSCDQANMPPSPLSIDHEVLCEKVRKHYSLWKTFENIRDVGWLQLKVIGAANVESKDLNGFSDPYCVIQLPNQCLRTHTQQKTLNPKWNREYVLPIRDIHQSLKISLFDEDRNGSDFLGIAMIPLLKITNGVPTWYGLKNETMTKPVKGAILLEMKLIYNVIRAAYVSLKLKEEDHFKFEPKFQFTNAKYDVSKIKKNCMKLKDYVKVIQKGVDEYQSIITWTNPRKSVFSLFGFVTAVWTFQLYMAPFAIAALIGFMRFGHWYHPKPLPNEESEVEKFIEEIDQGIDELESKAEKRAGLPVTIAKLVDKVQQILEVIVSFIERLLGIFQWNEPRLSFLAIILLIIGATMILLLPFRVILTVWGLRRGTKHLWRRRRRHSGNEIINFIQRVPNNFELQICENMYTQKKASSEKKRR